MIGRMLKITLFEVGYYSSLFKVNEVKKGEAMGPRKFKGLAANHKGHDCFFLGGLIFSVLGLDPRVTGSERKYFLHIKNVVL